MSWFYSASQRCQGLLHCTNIVFFCEGFVFTALWVVSDLVSFTVWRSWPQAEGNPSVAGFCGLAKWLHYRCGTKTNRRYCETTGLTSPPFCVVANVKLCQTITVENNRKHHAPKIKSNTNNRTRGSVVSCMFRSDVLFLFIICKLLSWLTQCCNVNIT